LPPPRFILASASPRRQALLRDAGYVFEVDPPEVDETPPPGLLPSKVALHLAQVKATAVAARHPDDVVLAADTVVAFGDTMLGKPVDAADARKMLKLLSGTTHIVITGVCVTRVSEPAFFKSTRVMSAVKMRQMTPGEIDRYVESKEWEGKAGGYGIQDKDPFVVRQSGSHTNIVGLPMSAARQLLEEAGIKPTPRE
jgi:septum formation protein